MNTSDYTVFHRWQCGFRILSVELRLRCVYQKVNRYDDAVTYVGTHQ